jgi:hypothetical protein
MNPMAMASFSLMKLLSAVNGLFFLDFQLQLHQDKPGK